MSVMDFLQESKSFISQRGVLGGGKLVLGELNRAILKRAGRYINFGTRCFEEDWEVFIILDACRHDIMQEVAEGEEYDFLPEEVPHKYSCASTSEEYVEKSFNSEFTDEMNETALVSANLWPEKLDEELNTYQRFADFTVRPYDWVEDNGYIPADGVTDAAIEYWRERPESVNRMIVWYSQPHTPYPSVINKYDWEMTTDEMFGKLVSGELSRDEAWEGYYNHLEYVLDEVEVLLDNIDADRVVISSDHGEAFGEFGIFRHPKYVPLPMLKKVPWVTTTATDKKTREPDGVLEGSERPSADDVNEHLKKLGYL